MFQSIGKTKMSLSINLLVLRCREIEQSRQFYEKLGLKFIKEKHGSGPAHYSADVDGLVLELYPAKEHEQPDNCRLGFCCAFIADISGELIHDKNIRVVEGMHERNGALVVVVADPDGRSVEISQKLHF